MSIFFRDKKNKEGAVIYDISSTEINTDQQEEAFFEEEKEEHPFLEIVRFAIIALIIVVPIRMFVAQPFIVSGASMEQTFHGGEYLIVDQLTYYFEEPQRGDVIIFRYPRDTSKFFIKRLIGVPGDTLAIEGNVFTLTNEAHPDGIIVDEPYVNTMEPNAHITEVLGDGEYFVMGDNRDHSSDSRKWGILSRDKIIGRAFLRLFPLPAVDVFPGGHKTDQMLLEQSSAF
ncbi:MAG: signal peptidase I [Candidatus Azotimanducaceae bacterium]|jgi:signal peptidase I